MKKNIIFSTCMLCALIFICKGQPTPLPYGDMSDEFNDQTSLHKWKFFNIEENLPNKIIAFDIDKTEKGCLYVEPYTACWYEGYYGVYLFKEIEGDFVVSTKIKIKGREEEMPKEKWSIAGLLLRQPGDETVPLSEKLENWLYINTGRGKGPEWVIDSKYTIKSESIWDATPSKESWVELRAVRIKSLFITMYRFPDENWHVHIKKTLDTFPEKLQVGVNISANAAFAFDKEYYNFNINTFDSIIPDMKVYVDYVRYNEIGSSPGVLEIINEQKLQELTDEKILENFSF